MWLDTVISSNMPDVGACMVLECVFNNELQRAEYIVDCDEMFGSGFWCGTCYGWQGQCGCLGEVKELFSPRCSLGISGV